MVYSLKMDIKRSYSQYQSTQEYRPPTKKVRFASDIDYQNDFAQASVKSGSLRRQSTLERTPTLTLDEIDDPYVDSEGNSPLHRGFRYIQPRHGDPEDPDVLARIKSYLDHRQYLNRQNRKGETPLMILVDQVPFVSMYKACALLIQNYADPTILNNADKSVCDYLSRRIENHPPMTPEEEASIKHTQDLFHACGVPPHKQVYQSDPYYNTNAFLHNTVFGIPVHLSSD
jgi:ankyrin repeat protein